MQPTLRPFRPEDKDFLLRLYASTRLSEIAAFGWSEAQAQAFLTVQFNAQQQWYEAAYPGADRSIIMLEEQPVGRIIVNRDDDGALLVDIALLPENRGRGLGGAVLLDLLDRCRKDRIPLRLQVLRNNPAQRLYERLGFLKTGEDQVYIQMELPPGEASSAVK